METLLLGEMGTKSEVMFSAQNGRKRRRRKENFFRKSSSKLLAPVISALLFGNLASIANGDCGFPGAPAHSSVDFSTRGVIRSGTVAKYSCDRGFELLGPARRICNGTNGTWTPQGIPFCVLNVAAGKAPMQSSVADGGIPQKAVDGSTSTFFDEETCSMTDKEQSPWWYVNLLEPYMVQLVRVDFGHSCCGKGRPATIVVRVGNNRPDLGVNPVCNRFTGALEEGRPLFLPCNPPMPGAFVSVHVEGPPGQALSVCEAFVYTDQALPIERCPHFRDQPPGATATYNGKCYIFYNQQPKDFQNAMEFCEARGGSLVDESNPALQGFLSWELWRRHKGDANGQYWLGAVRDRADPKNWRWLNGKPVSVSFWNLPGGNDNCARFDGTKGWLWSDTNCGLKLNFICQHRPTTCGKPEQPPNSTLVAPDGYDVGSRIAYDCDEGHLLVGPSKRTCLQTGFYSEFPPVCRFLECGLPADVDNGEVVFLNGTRRFKSLIRYSCDPGYYIVGQSVLRCDVDERWDGPPPRCDPVYCDEPPQIRHGGFSLSTNSTRFGTVASYYCTSPRHFLSGSPKIRCLPDGSWDAPAPACRAKKIPNLSSNSDSKRPIILPTALPSPNNGPSRRPTDFSNRPFRGPSSGGRRPPPFSSRDDSFSARPPISKQPTSSIGGTPQAPIDNEIPDSANVRSHPGQGANVPGSKSNEVGGDQARKLNLGGIIALGVFGGFVFLAAIITTIVILIRRFQNNRLFGRRGRRGRRQYPSFASPHGTPSTSSTIISSARGGITKKRRGEWSPPAAPPPPPSPTSGNRKRDPGKPSSPSPNAQNRKEPLDAGSPSRGAASSSFRAQRMSSTSSSPSVPEPPPAPPLTRNSSSPNSDRDAPELLISSYSKPEKQQHHQHQRRHHHHHHHRHKHRHGDNH